MKKVKVTVTVLLTLSPGVELVEDFVSNDEKMGAHLKVGGKLYCPWIEWMEFLPRNPDVPRGLSWGQGHSYSAADEAVYHRYFAREACPVFDHRIEVIDA